MSLTNGRASSVGDMTGVFPSSLLSVTVANLQNAGILCGADVVFVRCPDGFAVLGPGHMHVPAARECDLKPEWLTNPECHVFQPFHKANRFYRGEMSTVSLTVSKG